MARKKPLRQPKGTRRFAGRLYSLVRPARHKTVAAAKREAKRIRKRGFLARRVKRSVYVRNK